MHLDGADVTTLEGGEQFWAQLMNGRPRGTWHRAVVPIPGDTLHITWGAGTEHRPGAG